jgi:hypothetical protein
MGASLTMIDHHYGHLARDGHEHAIRLLDELSAGKFQPWTLVDAAGVILDSLAEMKEILQQIERSAVEEARARRYVVERQGCPSRRPGSRV